MTTAIYIRVSSKKEAEKKANKQLDACLQYATQQGLEVEEKFIFMDLGDPSRSALERLLEQAENGKLKTLLVGDVASLTRDSKYLQVILDYLDSLEVSVIDVSSGGNLSNENTRMIFEIKTLLNQRYIQDLRTRITRGQKQLINQKVPIGKLGYGYRKRRGKGKSFSVIQKKEASVIRRIFSEYASGKLEKDIAAGLNADGIKPITGKRWHASIIVKILSNEKYIGRFVWGRKKSVKDPRTGQYKKIERPESEWTSVEIPKLRIVSDELWDAALKRLGNRR